MAYLIYAARYLVWLAGSLRRRLARPPEYVLFVIEDSYPVLAPPRPTGWQRFVTPRRMGLRDLQLQVRQAVEDPRTRGVVFHLRPVSMTLAQVQMLREIIEEVKAARKRAICWSTGYNTATYYAACAADEILLQEGSVIGPLGLHRSYVFLADSLRRIGLKADVVQISPYKTAGDVLSRTDFSKESRQMAEWLLDSDFKELVTGVAQGRSLSEAAARKLIDNAPYTDQQALAAGAVDALIAEEDLRRHLAGTGDPPALAPWAVAGRRLLRRPPSPPGRFIALLRIEGSIVDGRSATPPVRPPIRVPFLADVRAGDLTVVEHARRLFHNRRAAAVVVWVDSGGGSAAASEAMAASLRSLAATRPVVACMGSLAGSGGYYVVTPASWIVAEPSTLTGSIGVLNMKLVSGPLLDNLLIHQRRLVRGRHADFDDPTRPLTAQERKILFGQISRIYEVFLDRVARSRSMDTSAVDAIGGGRVWTGRQAVEKGLVDELGGLERAISKARELAGLGDQVPVREVRSGRGAAAVPPGGGMVEHVLEGWGALERAGALYLTPVWPAHL
jgi:protease-4